MADKKVEALNNLISKFPGRYKVRATTQLLGLLEALAEGDGYINTQVENVRDNLLVISASGKNLDRLGSLYGVTRGTGTGVQDDDFRNLIPILGLSPKQIIHSLQRVIDAIYGPFATHANTTSSAPAPYFLQEESSLRIRVDDGEVVVHFRAQNVAHINAVTAQEAASIITDQSSGRLIASVVSNTRTGEQFVNIRTTTIGSQGFVQVLGGESQTALRFPQIRQTRQAIATWNVTRFEGSAEMNYDYVSGVSPGMQMAQVRIGDIVTIRDDSGFDTDNVGSFPVTFVEENSFRVKNGNGRPESGVTQQHVDDFTFYRPDLGNILLAARPATILQTGARELTVLLPVTSPIVKRTLKGGHHFHGGSTLVTGTTSTTAEVGSTSGFPATGSIRILTSRESAEATCQSASASTLHLVSAQGWPTSGAAYSTVTQTFYYYQGVSGNVLQNVTPSPAAADVDLAGSPLKYSPRFSYTGITPTQVTGVFPDPAPAKGYEVVSEVEITPKFQGSFVYDEAAQFTCAAQATRLNESIDQGSSRTVVDVMDVSGFPESGQLVLEAFNREQEGPIRFLGKVGTQALIIDPSHVFKRDHLKGATLRLIRQLGYYRPRTNGSDYPVYLTGTSQARSLVAAYLQDIIAAGIVVRFQIIEPSQKWPVLAPLNSESPFVNDLA